MADRYRKKPVVVEAFKWDKNGDHPDDGHETFISPSDGQEYRSEGKVVRYYRRPDVSGESVCFLCDARMHDHGWIDTIEGGHAVCPGDWIITGVKGERYPCNPDIFAMTYEPVDCG